MSERELLECVRQEALRFGWLMYHTYDSRRSGGGFPDLVLVRGECLMFRELKGVRGRVDLEQLEWLRALADAGQNAKVWWDTDWPDRIIRELR